MNALRKLGKTALFLASLVFFSFASAGDAVQQQGATMAARRPVERPKTLLGKKIDGDLAFTVTPQVQKYLDYYTKGRGRGVAIRGIVRSTEVREDAKKVFRDEGVPAELVWLAQAESGWRSVAVSPVGAAGVWQFMPATGQRFGLEQTEDSDERLHFEKSTRAAARYLKILNRRYDGDWLLAIGAYNCGEGAMDRAIERAGGVRDFWELSDRGVLPTETANYVPSVLAATIFGSDPANFDLDGRDAVSEVISARGKG